MSTRANPRVIGSFVIGALAIAVAAITVFGSGQLFKTTYPFVCFFKGNVNGLKVGAPVKFKGVEIGQVTKISLALSHVGPAASTQFRIPVLFEIDADKLIARGGATDLGDRETVHKMIDEGLRAQLGTESLLTGQLYLALDLFPNTPLHLVLPPDSRYIEIPTIPTPLEQVQSIATRVLNKLDQIDLPKLLDSAVDTLKQIRAITSSPSLQKAISHLDETENNFNQTLTAAREAAHVANGRLEQLSKSVEAVSQNANVALGQATADLKSANTILQPGSPLAYQLSKTLEEVSSAAASMRELADYLQRNPGALVRGRDLPEPEQPYK
jgi:paraquat-inducible protein B